MWGTINQLGGPVDAWSVVADANGRWGWTYSTGQVEIDKDVPCRHVADVVRHEWMHLKINALPGDHEPDEILAGCGSKILGSELTPTVQQRIDIMGYGCLPGELLTVRAAIASPDFPYA